jgi:hypothetical protein
LCTTFRVTVTSCARFSCALPVDPRSRGITASEQTSVDPSQQPSSSSRKVLVNCCRSFGAVTFLQARHVWLSVALLGHQSVVDISLFGKRFFDHSRFSLFLMHASLDSSFLFSLVWAWSYDARECAESLSEDPA